MRQLKISHSITNREDASLQKYLLEINKIPLLSAEEETQLAEQIKQGDRAALEKLTRANLRFVISVAKQYQYQGLSLSDLINEGNIGLIKAAERFDMTRGFKFISFAVWWIRQSIIYAISTQARLVRIPTHKISLANRARKTQSQLEQSLEREPTLEELAENMNLALGELEHCTGNTRHTSLDAPTLEDESGSLADTLANPNATPADKQMVYTDSLHQELSRTLETLPLKQRETICYFFGIGVDHPLTLNDIANRLDVTVERARQIKEKALLKLRTTQNMRLLQSFLG